MHAKSTQHIYVALKQNDIKCIHLFYLCSAPLHIHVLLFKYTTTLFNFCTLSSVNIWNIANKWEFDKNLNRNIKLSASLQILSSSCVDFDVFVITMSHKRKSKRITFVPRMGSTLSYQIFVIYFSITNV